MYKVRLINFPPKTAPFKAAKQFIDCRSKLTNRGKTKKSRKMKNGTKSNLHL